MRADGAGWRGSSRLVRAPSGRRPVRGCRSARPLRDAPCGIGDVVGQDIAGLPERAERVVDLRFGDRFECHRECCVSGRREFVHWLGGGVREMGGHGSVGGAARAFSIARIFGHGRGVGIGVLVEVFTEPLVRDPLRVRWQ